MAEGIWTLDSLNHNVPSDKFWGLFAGFLRVIEGDHGPLFFFAGVSIIFQAKKRPMKKCEPITIRTIDDMARRVRGMAGLLEYPGEDI